MKSVEMKELTTTETWVTCPKCDINYAQIVEINGIIECPGCKEKFTVKFPTGYEEWGKGCLYSDTFEVLKD